MSLISSFPPVSDARARILILGSMPGAASLKAGQYYAHPRNHFWRIMGELTGAGPGMPYERRLEILKDKKVALWDVLQCCRRPGSLDSNITHEVANDFPAFFAAHKNIRHMFFNGAPPEKFFRKFAAPFPEGRILRFTRLPSTSPANASCSFERKLKAWQKIFQV